MDLVRLLWIGIYLIIVLLLIWGVNKMTRDSKSVMGSLAHEVNELFLIINSYIAHHRDIDKFEDLTEVIYAKKHRFLGNKTHLLADRYELYVGLKDDINYLSDYTQEDLKDAELYKLIDQKFLFLFNLKPWIKGLRFFVIMVTLGIALGFLEDRLVL